MDGQRFDSLTKALTRMPSRRGVVRGLVGGAAAALLGRSALDVAAADVSPQAFDLTCRNSGTQFFCSSAGTTSTCKNSASGCVCAQTLTGTAKCIEQPPGGCPTRRTFCKRNNDCTGNQICIKVDDCCGSPKRGKCVTPCPA